MAESRDLLVRILGDDRDLQKTVDRSEKRLKQFDGRTSKASQAVRGGLSGSGLGSGTSFLFGSTGFVAAASLSALATKSVQAASSLNEEINKSQEVFGKASESVRKWAETTSQSFGISERAALQATGVFGNLFKVVNLAPAQSADLSRALVELAADLASFNNADPSEVLLALRSGLIGEAEPLRRFGVLLSEARVQQEAMAESGKKNVSSLTNQEKLLARYRIILHDTATAQGDFARTADSLANQQRTLAANVEDLAAAFGGILVPKLSETVGGINDLVAAFQRLRDAIPGEGGGGRGPTGKFFDEFTKSLPTQLSDQVDNLKRMGDDIEFLLKHGPFEARPEPPFKALGEAIKQGVNDLAQAVNAAGSPLADVAARIGSSIDGLVAALEKRKRAFEKAQRLAAKQRFDDFVKGQGLKLDKALLTTSLDDDLAALKELEAAILRRIDAEGKTFNLVSKLVDTRIRIAAVVGRQAADAKRAGEEAFNATVDALTLDLDMARETKSLADDQARLRALEHAILARISTEGQTTDLMRQLFDVRQEQKDVAQKLRDQQRERRKGKQFEALGLTAEGEERTPSIRALRNRGRNLIKELEASGLDEAQVAKFVKRISVIFTDKFDGAGKDIRNAILEMFATINGALEQGGKKVGGPLTKTTSLNTKKILEGLGLSAEEERALRSRLSNFNSAGQGLPGANRTSTTGRFVGPGDVVVENNVTVEIDGKKVTATVTKQQQKKRRRNPVQKRGPNRHR